MCHIETICRLASLRLIVPPWGRVLKIDKCIVPLTRFFLVHQPVKNKNLASCVTEIQARYFSRKKVNPIVLTGRFLGHPYWLLEITNSSFHAHKPSSNSLIWNLIQEPHHIDCSVVSRTYILTLLKYRTDFFFLRGDPRWWKSKWKVHQPPPRTKLELQLNYRRIILNNRLNTGWREAL